MPTVRSYEGDAIPKIAANDEDTTAGMAFSILVTVCTLVGLLFCFRRASRLLPRNLNIQLQMFKESLSGGGSGMDRNGRAGARGPIALSDDDLEGAVGIDWEALDEEILREGGEIYNDDDEEERVEDDDEELAVNSRAFEDDPEDEEEAQARRRTDASA